MVEKLVLRTALGKHAHVKPLRDGRVVSDRLVLSFEDYDPLPEAFRQMIRGGNLDLSEMAAVTHLLAHHYKKPLVGLAIPLWGRLPHTNLIVPQGSDISAPTDLEGRKVGVRAYGQTSGVWVRGILESEYGVDINAIEWVTMEDSHLVEYEDPSIAWRYRGGQKLRDLMLSGDLAAIMGERNVSAAGIRTVIDDAEGAAKVWVSRTGIEPINHGVVLRSSVHAEHPWVAQEVMEMFTAARRIAIEDDGVLPPAEYGLEANRGALDLLFAFSARQSVPAQRYHPEDLFLPL